MTSWSETLLSEVACFRYAMVAFALLWSWASLRARAAWLVLLGTLFLQCVLGYWILVLGAPYGFGVEPTTTRILADAGVAASSGGSGDAFVSGMPLEMNWLTRLAAWGVPNSILLWLPTLLPLLTGPALAWLVFVAWRRRSQATLAAVLWLLFSTDRLSSVRGLGFVAGLWPRPGWSLAVLGWAAAILLADRIGRRTFIAATLGFAALMALTASAAPSARDSFVPALIVDQGIWLLLGGIGLWRKRGGAPLALVVSGLGVFAVSALRAADPWPGLVVLRLGLFLAAARPIHRLLRRFHQIPACGRLTSLLGARRSRLGWALLVLIGASSAYVIYWHPLKEDGIAWRTVESRSVWPLLAPSLNWIRDNTPPCSVVMLSEPYTPFVAAVAGRRVLRSPTLLTTADDENRLLLEKRLIRGRRWASLARRYSVTHVLVGPGDYSEHGLTGPEQLDGRAGLVRRHVSSRGFMVYEIDPSKAQ